MKKNFLKKLALAMALVVTATSVNVPAASAAATPGFKSEKVTVKVDQTKKYSTANSSKYSVKFKIGNTSVATIKYSKGSKAVKVTGVAEGKTTLRADFTSYSTKKVTTQRIPVTVKAATPVVTTAELASVKQTAANAFEATFTADASQTITAESFTNIESADGIYTTTVNTVEFSADGKTAKVTTYGNFVDKVVYNVTCADKTASFTASVGAVSNVVITTTQAQKGVETDIKFALYDANGIDVTPVIALNTNVTVDVDGDYSAVDTAKASKSTITMDTVGDKATVTVTYDALDGSAEVKATQTITCVDAQTVVGTNQIFTFGNEQGTALPKVYLNSYSANTTVYMDAADDGYFVAVDKNGDAISYDTYEIESSNDSVFTVSEDNTTGKYASFTVDPVATGTAQVVIKATKNDKTYTYAKTVTVKPARVATSIVLGSSSLSLSNAAEEDYGVATTAYVLDQYGKVMLGESKAIQTEIVTEDATTLDAYIDGDHNLVVVTAQKENKGSYVVKLTASDTYGNEVSKKFTVSVKNVPEETKSNVTYKVELTNKTIDLNPEGLYGVLNESDTIVSLAKYVGGVFAEYVDTVNGEGVTVTVKKGQTVYGQDLTTTGSAITVSGSGIRYSAIASAKETAKSLDQATDIAATGTYTVTVVYKDAKDNDVKKTASFTVKNTQEMPSVKVSATTVDSESVDEIIADCLTTDVSILSDNGYDAITGLYTYNTKNKEYVKLIDKDFTNSKLTIKYVAVEDTFYGVTYTYYVPVTKTFKAD